MGLSDGVDEHEDLGEVGRDLVVSLNGFELSEVATYEAEAYGLPRRGPAEMGMVTAAFAIDDRGNNLEIDMRVEDAERVAYDLLAKVRDARELVEYE